MISPLGPFTLTIRKLATGYKEASFVIDDLTHAHTIARILVASRVYGHCFVVGTDCTGAIVLNVQPGGQQPEALPAPPQARASVESRPLPKPALPTHVTPRVSMPVNRPAPSLSSGNAQKASSAGGVDRLIAAVKMLGR